MWIRENVSSPSLDGISLRCSIAGGEPTPPNNVHCYRDLLAQPAASRFTLALTFWFSSTTCDNQQDPSIIQALEFTMNKWQDGKRYEWALQWQNVGEKIDSTPQWRYWNQDTWIAFNPPITQCLQGGNQQVHTLTMDGDIVNGQVHYISFTIDGVTHSMDITVPSTVPIPPAPNKLAVAVQLDGNSAPSPYDLYVDKVTFIVTH